MRELIDKAHKDILRYPNLFESKARELKTYNEHIEERKLEIC